MKAQWNSWQLYLTITSSAIATLGILFGAFVPMVKWLSLEKSFYWLGIAFILFTIFYLVVKRDIREKKSVAETKGYQIKLITFSVVWILFPYILCTSSYILGDKNKNCFCKKFPIEVIINLRKSNDLLVISNDKAINELIRRTEDKRQTLPKFRHTAEIERILKSLKSDELQEEVKDFVNSWENREKEIKLTLMRLIAEYSNSALAPSELSREFYERLSFQIKNSPSGMVVLGGEDALTALQALMEKEVDYKPMVDELIDETANKFLQLSLLKLYSSLKYIPKHYADGIDSDFMNFIRDIPGHDEIVKKIGFKDKLDEEYVRFETGNPSSKFRTNSYSRFIVPESELTGEVLQRMSRPPWPIGKPNDFFSEEWWMKNATWQMLGRESGKWLDNLAIRIQDFDALGPP